MPEISITSREQWLELRRTRIGASDVAALFGMQPAYASSLYSLHHIKTGQLPEPEVTSEIAEAGLLFESAIADKVANLAEVDIQKTGYWTHPRVDGFGCTPDYLCMARPCSPAAEWLAKQGINPEYVGAFEVKNVGEHEWRRRWLGNTPSCHIIIQHQAQMACIECDWGIVASCVGGNHFQFCFMPRKPRIIAALEDRVSLFWRRVRDGEPPDIDGSESTSRALAALYPESDCEPAVDMTSDSELPDLCQQWRTSHDMRCEYEKAERHAANRILGKLGQHRSARCSGWVVTAPTIAATPDLVIDETSIGRVIKGRKAYRRLSIRENEA